MLGNRFRTIALSFSAVSALGLAACSGGGGSSATPTLGSPLAPTTATKLGVTLAGTTPFASSFHALSVHAQSVQGTPIVVTFNGATVATGTLDSSGFAELTFTQAVPAGSVVVVTIGSGSTVIVASVPLVNAVPATAAYLTFNPGPPATLNVKAGGDAAGNGHYDSNENENEDEDEDPQTGNVVNITDANKSTLPANLPIVVSACSSSITVGLNANASPAPSGHYALEYKEKTSDDNEHDEYEYHVDPFTTPVTFPVVNTAARVRIELERDGVTILKLKAPLGAFTSGFAAPATCPTVTPTISASPMAAATATASPMPLPTATHT